MSDKKPIKNSNPLGNKIPKLPKFNFYWIYGIIAVVLLAMPLFKMEGANKEINWQTFEQEMLLKKHVQKIEVINKEIAEVYIKTDSLALDYHKDIAEGAFGDNKNKGPHYHFNIGSVETFETKLQEAQKDFNTNDRISAQYTTSEGWGFLLNWLPFILIIGFWIFMMRRMSGGGGGGAGQLFNIGKSKAVQVQGESINITFDNVAGLDEAKVEIKEIVDFLKSPKKYTDLGAKIPRGALLVGPPGTGKTLLAKAVAGEAKVPFFSMSGSDFVEMFVGVGASRVRDLFKQAKDKSPCIIFIDEIDAIGRARGKSGMQGGNDERENTLNQLLTEMDGFGTNSGVIILAATNRADVLDKALMRAGRFDRQIHVDLPDLNGRKAIFDVHMKELKLNTNVDRELLAKQTPGFSGAEIANICNEAALIAARRDQNNITQKDFHDAIDRVIGGLEKKNKIITKKEKKTIAIHEAGHAAVSWLLEHASPLVKVTIIPRGQSLGAAWYLPTERQITTTEQLDDEMCAALGGRAAEQVVFGKISTGALSDLEKVTKQATAMVSIYGLNDKIGNLSYYDSSGQADYSFNKPYSEQTARTIDEEISKMVEVSYDRAKKILSENKDKLIQLSELLLEKEVIFKEDLESVFGTREWIADELEEQREEEFPAKAKLAAGSPEDTFESDIPKPESKVTDEPVIENPPTA